jgi:Flp pilus assembly pilin Flp
MRSPLILEEIYDAQKISSVICVTSVPRIENEAGACFSVRKEHYVASHRPLLPEEYKLMSSSHSPSCLSTNVQPDDLTNKRKISEEFGCLLHRAWSEERGQDIAEYAVMLAVILVIVVGTIRLIGTNANNVFSSAASSIQ